MSASRRTAPGRLTAEIARYLKLGVDGFFTDNPDLGRRALRAAR